MTRVEVVAERAVARQVTAVSARLREAVPDAQVTPVRDGVAIAGKRLRGDTRLRWVGGLLR